MIESYLASRAPARRFGGAAAGPSYALSNLVAASATGTADGSTTNACTLTLYDTNGVLMPSRAITRTVERTFISAADCTLTADASEVESTSGVLNLTLTIKNASGVGLPGRPTAAIVWDYSGSGETFTPTSSVSDRAGVYLARFSSTAVGSGTISVTVNGVLVTQTVAITVTGAAPALPTAEFRSSFKTSLGQTAAALRDTGNATTTWTTHIGDTGASSNGEVIAATGLGFPSGMSNVLRLTYNATRDGLYISRKTGLTVPAIGETQNRRFYIRVDLPDSLTDYEQHPVQDGNGAGDTNVMFKVLTPGTDHYFRFHCQGGTNFRYNTSTLAKATVFRVEYQVYRVASGTFRLHVWIYDVDNVLLRSDSSFVSDLSPFGTLADNPIFTLVNAANLDGLNCGSNGIGGSPSGPFVQSYQSGFYVCHNQRAEGVPIGPFDASVEEV